MSNKQNNHKSDQVNSNDGTIGHNGSYQKALDNRSNQFLCKWNDTELRPFDQPEYISSSVPCQHYRNRTNVTTRH